MRNLVSDQVGVKRGEKLRSCNASHAASSCSLTQPVSVDERIDLQSTELVLHQPKISKKMVKALPGAIWPQRAVKEDSLTLNVPQELPCFAPRA